MAHEDSFCWIQLQEAVDPVQCNSLSPGQGLPTPLQLICGVLLAGQGAARTQL